MDFFEHQDRARRRTSQLVIYFFLAVALIIMAVYGVFALVFLWLANYPQPRPGEVFSWWNPELFLWVTTGTVLVVILGSLYKIITLSQGGESVALLLGARPVPPNATDPAERRLLNVVEEMSIASGTPVPRVFLLEEEDGINAFAAGFSTADAVIGVTRGCMTLLTRDELQGVIAHEFSHILNGDMRLNLRLMGILHGILVIALIGYMIFRIVLQPSSSRSVSAGRKKGGGVVLIMILGLGLMIIGYIGVFFAKLIKSAVSRQREFLADAASVQFTRNPDGLAGALKKIGGLFIGSRIHHPKAEEASHFFFADGLRASFFNLMATHPPLIERIRRMDPSFDGTFASVSLKSAQALAWQEAEEAQTAAGESSLTLLRQPARTRPGDTPYLGTGRSILRHLGAMEDKNGVLGFGGFRQDSTCAAKEAASAEQVAPRLPPSQIGFGETRTVGSFTLLSPEASRSRRLALQPETLMQSIGRPRSEHLSYAAALMASMPPSLQTMAHESAGAQAIMFSLLLNKDPALRDQQLRYLQQHAEPLVYQQMLAILPSMEELAAELRLPLVDLALSALRPLSQRQFADFKETLKHLIESDATITLFEYTLQRMVVRHLESAFSLHKVSLIQYYDLKPLWPSIQRLLSTLAYYGQSETAQASQAFTLGAAKLKVPLTLLPKDQCGLQQADKAIDLLVTASPQIKKRVLDACAACISADGRTTVAEAELLRAIADSLGCPIPPLLPD